MRYDAILFDLDGTLTRSEAGIVNSVRHALQKAGYADVPRESLLRFIGPPLFESFRGIPGMDDEGARQAVERYRERFSEIGWRENEVYTGIPALLRALKEEGAYLAVASAKPLLYVRKILDYFALTPYFDRVEAISLGEEHADKAELVRRALPETCRRACMVGDRSYDMEGAAANGVDGIGALFGYGSREELEKAGASFIAEDVSALSAHLLGGRAPARGLFFSFEGSDGCGKSTQMRMAAEWLTACGWEVVATREPGGCPVSERIRELLLDVKSEGMTPVCEALLFAAARAQHVETVIEPALRAGKLVLCDRFVDSSAVYQGAGRGLGVAWVRQVNEPAVRNTMPDATLLYALDPHKALARRGEATGYDRIELERGVFVERVYDTYLRVARAEPERFEIIDGDGTPEAVFERTRARLGERLAR